MRDFTEAELGSQLEIIGYDEDGNETFHDFGPTLRERKYNHAVGMCDAMCSFCYEEGCEWLAENSRSSGAMEAQRTPNA